MPIPFSSPWTLRSLVNILCFLSNHPSPTWKEQDIEKVCHLDGTVQGDKAFLAGKSQQPTFYSRVVTNRLRYGPLSKDFLPSPSPVNIYDKNTFDLYALGFNTLAADYIDEETVGSHIWTWSRDLKVRAGSGCDEDCGDSRPAERDLRGDASGSPSVDGGSVQRNASCVVSECRQRHGLCDRELPVQSATSHPIPSFHGEKDTRTCQ